MLHLNDLYPLIRVVTNIIVNLILLNMDLSHNNIKRITKSIQSTVEYNFLNPSYTIGFQDDQVLHEQNDKVLKQVCTHCLLVPRYLIIVKCEHLTCFPCLSE